MKLLPELVGKLDTLHNEERDALGRWHEEERQALQRRQEYLGELFEYCDSPLEQIFLLALLRHLNTIGLEYNVVPWQVATVPYLDCAGYGVPGVTNLALRIFPQGAVQRGTRPTRFSPEGVPIWLRIDFLFELVDLDSSSLARREIALEIDGHDFHEKTKEQARRDKERDRFLTMRDMKLLRYTGREINTNPGNALKDVFTVLEKFAGELKKERGLHVVR